jgi:hypothetical protein
MIILLLQIKKICLVLRGADTRNALNNGMFGI